MVTKVWRVDPEAPDPCVIREAAAILCAGGLVAFPTETVYGLGANALDETAVRKIFVVKERPLWDPLIVHISRPEMAERLAASLPEAFWQLAEQLMPGPLTVVVRKRPTVPDAVTGSLPTVALRMPSHPVALALLDAAGVPVAAPSANRFGRPSPTRAEHVLADLNGRIDGVLDAGPTPIGVESTVVDLTTTPPTILRPGGVSKETLEAVLGTKVQVVTAPVKEGQSAPSPGMTAKHYAPAVPVLLVAGNPQGLTDCLQRLLDEQPQGRVGLLLPSHWASYLPPALRERCCFFDWGAWGDWAELARRLFEGLRWLERQRVTVILAPLPPPEGLGLAVRDRLLKAAGQSDAVK